MAGLEPDVRSNPGNEGGVRLHRSHLGSVKVTVGSFKLIAVQVETSNNRGAGEDFSVRQASPRSYRVFDRIFG